MPIPSFEIISNSIDEARDGHGNRINVTLYPDHVVEVEDFGRGIPVDYNKAEDRWNWDLVFCELYAGGKYAEGSGNYDFSLGLNGLGLCATQYASEWMTADIYRDGFHYHLDFKKGENVGGLQRSRSRASAPARSSAGSRTPRSLPTSPSRLTALKICCAARLW